MICLRMGKTNTAKTPLGDFNVTTLEIPLLSQQAVTSKGISVLYTNLQLNPYPNTQLDLFCSDNFSFWCMALSTWLTNYADPSTRLQSPTREGCWLQSSSVHSWWRSRRCLVTKPYGAQTQQLLHKNDEIGQILSPSQFTWTNFTQHLCNVWTLLESKQNWNSTFHKPWQMPYLSSCYRATRLNNSLSSIDG